MSCHEEWDGLEQKTVLECFSLSWRTKNVHVWIHVPAFSIWSGDDNTVIILSHLLLSIIPIILSPLLIAGPYAENVKIASRNYSETVHIISLGINKNRLLIFCTKFRNLLLILEMVIQKPLSSENAIFQETWKSKSSRI